MDLNIVRLIMTPSLPLADRLLTLVSGSGASFEAALRACCCTQPQHSCNGCTAQNCCAFATLTARKLSNDAELVRRHQRPSLPFVFERCDAASSEFGLTLLGPACQEIPLFLKAVVHLLGEGGGWSVRALDYQGTPFVIDPTSQQGLDSVPVLSAQDLMQQYLQEFVGCSKVSLTLCSPLRLMQQGRELNRFVPDQFIRMLLRRLSSLAAYYGTAADSQLFRTLAELSTKVSLISSDQADLAGRPVAQRGIRGNFILSGPFSDLGPYLALGSLLHVGKGASYGLGSFRISRFC